MNLAVARRLSNSCSSSSDPRVPRYAPLRNDLASRRDETGKHYGGFLLTLLDQVGGVYRVDQRIWRGSDQRWPNLWQRWPR